MRSAAITGLLILFMLPVVACVQETSQEAVNRAIEKTSQVQSYRSIGVAITHAGTETTEYSFELEFAAPDRYRGSAHSDGNWSESVAIGGQGYVRSSDKPQWQLCETSTGDGGSPSPIVSTGTVGTGADATPAPTPTPTGFCVVLVEPLEETLRPLRSLADIEVLADEEIDGVDCSHYRGATSEGYGLNQYGEGPDRESDQREDRVNEYGGWEINADLWIDGDHYIRQFRTEVRSAQPDPDTGDEVSFTLNTTTRLFDFNEAISIEPPQMD